MMRIKEIKGFFGKHSDGTVQVYECDQCGARTYALGLDGCPLCGDSGKLSDRYVTALDTVDSYMQVRGSRVLGADCGWPSLQTVYAAVAPGTVTNARFDLDDVGINATRAGIGGNPFHAGYREVFLLALDDINRYGTQALAEELVSRVVRDLGARHADQ